MRLLALPWHQSSIWLRRSLRLLESSAWTRWLDLIVALHESTAAQDCSCWEETVQQIWNDIGCKTRLRPCSHIVLHCHRLDPEPYEYKVRNSHCKTPSSPTSCMLTIPHSLFSPHLMRLTACQALASHHQFLVYMFHGRRPNYRIWGLESNWPLYPCSMGILLNLWTTSYILVLCSRLMDIADQIKDGALALHLQLCPPFEGCGLWTDKRLSLTTHVY